MRQTSLNLIAITVFSFTLMALLGPLFNLSPTVTATLAFSFLVLATFDTFQFQGQGGTILVDWFAGSSAETRDRILHHEAGHFLVAYLLDIPIRSYALNAWEAFKQGQKAQGGVQFEDQQLLSQLQQGQLSAQLLDRYCTVWMAGVAAENLTYQQAIGGSEDRQKIQALWIQLKRPVSEVPTKTRWATLQAQTLLETHQSAYQVLVEAMAKRTPVDQCCRLIEEYKIVQYEASSIST